jgi:hypothetical protein
MARKFRGVEIIREIDEAMDKGFARFVIGTQSKLSAASPVDTGRLASSWYVGKGVPDRSVPPERDAPGTVQIEKPSMEITTDSDFWISSNLPYTERSAFDPYNGRRGGGAWFTSIENRLAEDAQKAFDYFLRKVK